MIMRFIQVPQTQTLWDHPLWQGGLIALGIVIVFAVIHVVITARQIANAPRRGRLQQARKVYWPPTGSSDLTRLITQARTPRVAVSDPTPAAIPTPLPPIPAVQSGPRHTGRRTFKPVGTIANPKPLVDPALQLETVQQNDYQRTPLLNKEEARLLPVLDSIVFSVGQGHRVMAQTSLGEVIKAAYGSDANAHAAINSKRLDFAIVDAAGLLVCAVEYQGTGHYQGNAVQRDAIKREALRKAGVPMVEVSPDFSATELTATLTVILQPAPAAC